jgi:uncharacterized membrane protein YfcA
VLANTLPLAWKIVIIFLAGVAAGISNGIAGGGTFISFPALLSLGYPSLQANMSSSVGIVPSTLGGIRGFRHELSMHQRLFRELVPTCIAGSLVGTGFLLFSSASTFRAVVPWLIGTATLLFAAAPRLTKAFARIERRESGGERRSLLFIGIFVASVYGGYFGAGLGIVLLAVMALSLPYELNVLQGLRQAFGLLINGVAAIVFIVRGHLALVAVIWLLVGSLFGGWLGTVLIRRVSPKMVRVLVIVIGAATTIRLAVGS